MPAVSVIITCYNYGQYLSESINSVLNQTYNDYEIIVIDDGSTDRSQEILARYSNNPKVINIRQDNAGQPKAKNRGIQESSGKYVAFLDADDIWMVDKLEKQIGIFENPNVGVVYSRRKWIDQHEEEIHGNERTLRRGNVLNYIFIDNFICFSSSVIRKSMLDKVGYFDENLPMGIDYDLWLRLSARCCFDYADRPLVKYRIGHANLSQNSNLRYDCALRIMNKALNDPEIRSKLSWYVPRLAWADTWSNMGYMYINQGEISEGIKHYCKAVLAFPIYLQLWKRITKSLIRK